MSESKHTPGPWSVRRNVDPKKRWQYGHEVFGATARRLAITDSRGLFDEQDAANALLIAAAPQMLEALRRTRETLIGLADSEDRAGKHNAAANVRTLEREVGAAIAAATGGEQ